MDTMDKPSPSLTQKRSQARVLFRPLVENELLDKPVEQFLISLRFEQWGKLPQLGIEMGTFECYNDQDPMMISKISLRLRMATRTVRFALQT
jgi:hypothetical protein